MRKLGSTPILAVTLAILLSGCASGYKEFYSQAQGATPEAVAAQRAAPPPLNPIVERAQPGNSQEIQTAYLKRGYAVIGNSMFNSGRPVSEDSAVRQAQDVGADLVLILNPKYTGTVTSSVPITTPTTTTSYSTGTATAYGSHGSATAYGSGTTTTYGTTTNYIPIAMNRSDYGAVYFVKQRFDLGLVTRDLNDAERQELQTNRGAAVRVVVDGTPAFYADLLVGDVITTIDGVAVPGAKVFNELVRERRNKLISLAFIRRGQRIEKSVQLSASAPSQAHTSSPSPVVAQADNSMPTLSRKEKWLSTMAEKNGCVGAVRVDFKNKDGIREVFEASCENKTLEFTCEFSGPVSEGMDGIPFVAVAGKSYQTQPACWL